MDTETVTQFDCKIQPLISNHEKREFKLALTEMRKQTEQELREEYNFLFCQR